MKILGVICIVLVLIFLPTVGGTYEREYIPEVGDKFVYHVFGDDGYERFDTNRTFEITSKEDVVINGTSHNVFVFDFVSEKTLHTDLLSEEMGYNVTIPVDESGKVYLSSDNLGFIYSYQNTTRYSSYIGDEVIREISQDEMFVIGNSNQIYPNLFFMEYTSFNENTEICEMTFYSNRTIYNYAWTPREIDIFEYWDTGNFSFVMNLVTTIDDYQTNIGKRDVYKIEFTVTFPNTNESMPVSEYIIDSKTGLLIERHLNNSHYVLIEATLHEVEEDETICFFQSIIFVFPLSSILILTITNHHRKKYSSPSL